MLRIWSYKIVFGVVQNSKFIVCSWKDMMRSEQFLEMKFGGLLGVFMKKKNLRSRRNTPFKLV